MNPKFPIKIGTKLIADMLDPHPHELDMEAIYERLKATRRFSDHPKALTIHQHRHLVHRLVNLSRAEFAEGPDGEDLWQRVKLWAYHHDDHEGVIGDIVAPVKTLISAKTNILEIVEVKLDRAICQKMDIPYPNELVRGMVHRYDKAAETIEWFYALGFPLEDFNHPCPKFLMDQGAQLIRWARQHV